MADVCKPDAQVIIIAPSALDPTYGLRKKFLDIQGKWEYGLEMPYLIFELRRRIRDAGLVLDRYGGWGSLVSRALSRSSILSALLGKRVRTQKHRYNKEEYLKGLSKLSF